MPALSKLPLRSIELRAFPARLEGEFPFNVPAVRGLGRLELATPVTFLVGENGSGKSTLLESLACAAGSITVGTESVNRDPFLAQVREFSHYMHLTWNKRTKRGFFLRAEDFFGYSRRMAQVKADLQREITQVDEEYIGRSDYAKDLAKMPYAGEISAINSRYGEGLDSQSHGESFLLLFRERFVPGGLYLLDEPEAPLSPVRQLALLSMLKQMVEQDAQFIIATHSPILMAFPDAVILSFDGGQVRPVEYETLEHVQLTRDFLNNREAFLRHL